MKEVVNCNSFDRFRSAAIVQFAEIFSFERFYARLRRVFQTVDDILTKLDLARFDRYAHARQYS